MDEMIKLLLTIALFTPLLGFLLFSFFSRFFTRLTTAILGCLTILISFSCFVFFLYFYIEQGIESKEVNFFKILNLNNLQIDFKLTLDHLSLLMALIITGVGFLIHVYSVGYTDHEKEQVSYFAFMNFFIFAMLLLVLSSNLLLLFVGWEGVGLASYLLIGFWYKKISAAKAATKAFVVNRVGDLGFLLGILFTFYLFGTTDINHLVKEFQESNGQNFIFTALTLLFFIGAIGKSAQLPLQVWLPDAMAGPTPVSALIHAATMVTAGVYLIVRLHLLYVNVPLTLQIIGVVGGMTSLYASLCAFFQTDLKRVLAYSTISQLGLMFLACGTGAFYSAMFHLTMHAFIKGLLFLSAGNVVHMLHGETEMAKMGGLAKIFKKTHLLFLVGVLALSGIPPFAAFFSKDLILEQEYLAGHETLFYIALLASVLTGSYLMRAYLLTFRGELSDKNREDTSLKEAPYSMLIPCFILAFLAMTGGFFGATIGKNPVLEHFLKEIGLSKAEELATHSFIFSREAIMTSIGAFIGVLIPIVIYKIYNNKMPFHSNFLKNGFYLDLLYEKILVNPVKKFSLFLEKTLEPKIFQGMIERVGSSTKEIGIILRSVEDGQIRSYAAFMAIGAFLLIVYFTF